MKTEYQFDTIEDLASLFETYATRDQESAEGTKAKMRAQLLRESAHAWRSAARIIRNSTIGKAS